MVLPLSAVRATGALGYAHSVLGLGLAAVRGLSGSYAVLILLGKSSIARFPVDGGGGAIGSLGYTRSIPGLGCETVAGLRGRYPVRVLVGDSSVARMRVDSGGSLTILAIRLTVQVFDAILLRKHTRSKQHTRQQRQNFHLHLHDYVVFDGTWSPWSIGAY